ncbi:MAG: hypothetical protein HEP71_25210 [Roseivirga sp.]|nr:hypothetical protein [Roseivirga sp.]
MVIPLNLKFNKLLDKAWVLLVFVIPLHFMSTSIAFLDGTIGLKWLFYIVLFSTYSILKTARNQLELTSASAISYYWQVFGLKFNRISISRDDIKGLFINQLPSRYYALSLRVKDGKDIILLEAINNKQIKGKAGVLLAKIRKEPFFEGMNVKELPGREYVEKEALIARHKAKNDNYDNGFGEEDGGVTIIS